MKLTLRKKKTILIAAISIFLALFLAGLILLLLRFGGAAFLKFGERGPISIKSSEEKETHSSNFFEMKDQIIKSFETIAVANPGGSYAAQIGITAHHLPTALPFISSFYKELAGSTGPRQTFVIIGPDHLEKCQARIAMTKIPYLTPFGRVEIDREMESKILQAGASLDDSCFEGEHSIGVQTIFIKYLFPDAKIVPLLLSSGAPEGSIERITGELAASKDKITVIISADFSHHQTKERASQLDSESEQMIRNLDVSSLDIEHVDSPPSIRAAILLAEKMGRAAPKILGKENSFNFTGVPENTTGYLNVLFTNKNSDGRASLLFLGDLMFDRNIRLAAQKNGNNFIFTQIAQLLAGNDLVVANLEGPVTDNKSVSVGSLPGGSNNFIFTFAPDLAPTLFDNNIRLVSLGNNHILNFGQNGLEATRQYLNSAGVKYFGAPGGERGVIEEIGGVKIGFVNYNQFIGGEALEAEAAIEEIKKVKLQADIAVLYAHWGIEYAADANAAIKNLGRRFIDAGADLVIGSHPHVIQPAEEYNGKKIYYSLGNFVFDQYFSEAVRKGLAVIVKINSRDKSLEFEEKNLYLQTNGQTVIIE